MIKLTRPPEPQILCDNKTDWTQCLLSLVKQYGDYKNIPKEEKEAALKFYRHDDIKNALKSSSSEKCAFCEGIPGETGFAEVEHFFPKSQYMDKAFEWTNLLYSCKQCNNSKLNHDTLFEPIINPYDIDPKGIFTYMDIMIFPENGPYYDIANKTIEVCGLDDARLFSGRAAVLVSMRKFESDIREALRDFNEACTNRKKQNRLGRISNALSIIEELTLPTSKFSAYCTYLLDNSVIYREAKETVENFVKQIS